jgi:large subunit ribosomal protein L9
MKVILLQDVNKVGAKGELVEVSDGYARNFLIKRGLADEGTPGRVREWEEAQKSKRARDARMEREAEEAKKKIGGKRVTVAVNAGGEGKLFGSGTAAQIASALSSQLGVDVDKRGIKLEPPKQTGSYPFKIKLYQGVEAELTLEVVAE